MSYKSVTYAFTVTLHPKLYTKSIQEQYDSTYLELAKRLKCLPAKVELIAEITPMNKNIHYHGMIQFLAKSKDHILDFIDLFRQSKIFGYKNIKQIEDQPGWQEYIFKDILHTVTLLNRPAVILDEFDINNRYGFQDIAEIIDEQ